jgi:CBS domain-containing membrane protein
VELRAISRTRADPNCADIMSKHVVSIRPNEERQVARRLLLQHGIRTLPVTDLSGLLLGTVGLRELAVSAATVGDVMSPPSVADPDTPAIDIANALTDGSTHAVVIVGSAGEVVGMVTQTDLLTAFSRPPVMAQ